MLQYVSLNEPRRMKNNICYRDMKSSRVEVTFCMKNENILSEERENELYKSVLIRNDRSVYLFVFCILYIFATIWLSQIERDNSLYGITGSGKLTTTAFGQIFCHHCDSLLTSKLSNTHHQYSYRYTWYQPRNNMKCV